MTIFHWVHQFNSIQYKHYYRPQVQIKENKFHRMHYMDNHNIGHTEENNIHKCFTKRQLYQILQYWD